MVYRRRFRFGLSAAVIAICLATADAALAQQGQMFGNTSGFNSLSSLNGTSVIPGARSSSFGAGPGSLTPPSMGMNGMGMNGMGMSMGGVTGTSLVNQPRGLLGSSNSQNGMLGATQQGASQGNRNQQGFNNQRNNQGNRNQGNRGANRGNSNGRSQQQFTNPGNGQRGNNAERSVRPQLKVAFQSPRPKAAAMQKNVSARIGNLARREGFRGIDVDVEGGKVTLRGQVNSEESRKLAAMMVALEPGVRSVQNDLTVVPTPPAPAGE